MWSSYLLQSNAEFAAASLQPRYRKETAAQRPLTRLQHSLYVSYTVAKRSILEQPFIWETAGRPGARLRQLQLGCGVVYVDGQRLHATR